MILRYLAVFLIVFYYAGYVSYGNQPKDTLDIQQLMLQYQESLRKSKYDKALKDLNVLGDYLIYTELDHKESYHYFKSFKPYIHNCSQSEEKAKFYINYAEAATYAQDFEGSLEVLKEGIEMMERNQDSSLYEFGYAYLKAAENSNKLNRFTKSATYFQKAERLFGHQKDTLMLLWTKSGLSSLFSNYAIYDKAKAEREFIFKAQNQENYGQVIAIAHLGAASDAFFQDQPEEELYHIQKALALREQKADVGEIVNLLTLSFATLTYSRQGDKDQANYYFNLLKNKLEAKNNQIPFINSYYRLAQSQNALINSRFDDAEHYALEQLVKLNRASDWQLLSRAFLLLAQIHETQKNSHKALRYYKDYINLIDSVNKAAARRNFAYVQTQFETEKKDLQIARNLQDIKLLQFENRMVNQRFVFGGILIVVLSIALLIWRSRLFALKKVKLQQAFAKRLVDHLEQDRKHIAGELHDSIGQNLLLLKHKAQLDQKTDAELIQQTIDEVRSISQHLHPFQFENLGLLNSISYTVENFQNNSEIFYSEDIQIAHHRIAKEKEIFIYRMIQECLTNVEKHSKAKACAVRVYDTPSAVYFEVKDNGVGFDVSSKEQQMNSLGLKNLKERAELLDAQLTVHSEKNKGTVVTIKIKKT
ncbi:MAG: hypothetical protein CMF35_14095 [Leeuwenhoekiella sp.]|jgi:signal transduction histidine kinase|uniref:tetratricopeptide repeat-containing sensor histidine kinase n=2 Tax=Flavobacteriaceae TaxID=49546 RepID=UPI000C55471C|nr:MULTISPECIES: sensor histidine kinase [Leeuwenhoekiella]MAO44756.1 hypothetical protein [Leeuwenhoekiella sp.]MBQ52789.1 hypothetical protein [Leeuwenhoekiella sp.]HBT08817.1 hypothetical protein [Leeuwenhoekiella sp.]HCW65208.1 hypothetical protein [Leeuwenhoekiella sp.]|tara:strand:- start:3012 stop:4952 length:1941 start_codon:yes stop_codon:yes gene_type:complete